MDLEEIKDIE